MSTGLPVHRNAADRPEVERVLRRRAEALARRVEDEEIVEGIQVVVLQLGRESYGVDAMHLTEVRPVERLTAVPNVPPLWAGLIALRGTLFPVLDLRRFLGLPPEPDVEEPKIAVVSAAGLAAGLLVDDASEVRRVPLQDMDPLFSERPIDGIRAVTPDLLSILDLEAILTDPRLAIPDRTSDIGGDE